MKKCNCCKDDFPINFFPLVRKNINTGKEYRRGKCKFCCNPIMLKASRKWRKLNPNKVNELSKKDYALNKTARISMNVKRNKKAIQENPQLKIKSSLRRRLWDFVKKKSLKTETLLGC